MSEMGHPPERGRSRSRRRHDLLQENKSLTELSADDQALIAAVEFPARAYLTIISGNIQLFLESPDKADKYLTRLDEYNSFLARRLDMIRKALPRLKTHSSLVMQELAVHIYSCYQQLQKIYIRSLRAFDIIDALHSEEIPVQDIRLLQGIVAQIHRECEEMLPEMEAINQNQAMELYRAHVPEAQRRKFADLPPLEKEPE